MGIEIKFLAGCFGETFWGALILFQLLLWNQVWFHRSMTAPVLCDLSKYFHGEFMVSLASS